MMKVSETLSLFAPYDMMKRETFWYHVLFWIGYFALNVIRWGRYFGNYMYSIQSNLVEFPIHIIITYINIYFLLPKFVAKKAYLNYVILLFLLILHMSIIRIFLNYTLVTTEIWPESQQQDIGLFDLNYIIAVFIGELYVVGITSAIWLVMERVKERDVQQQLEQEKLKTELSYLKAQIQPHFFFNTLNSLYSLALKGSENTSMMIFKLSQIMNFVIYKGKEQKVPLIDIALHIRNYLELEKLRFGDRLDIDFEINGKIHDIEFAPLVLSSLVENAIKHGKPDSKGKIKVNIKLDALNEDKMFRFLISNTKNPEAKIQNDKNKQVGLRNVTRRLALQYNNCYTFEINDIGNYFDVKLQVECEK